MKALLTGPVMVGVALDADKAPSCVARGDERGAGAAEGIQDGAALRAERHSTAVIAAHAGCAS
jgi:hypothetical protein